jgi:hypothetical protein
MGNYWLWLADLGQAVLEMEEYINKAYKGEVYRPFDFARLVFLRNDFLDLHPKYIKYNSWIHVTWYYDIDDTDAPGEMYVYNAVVKMVNVPLVDEYSQNEFLL